MREIPNSHLQEEAAITESANIAQSYHGHIRENARCCWVSFPGKYAAGREFAGNSDTLNPKP